MKQFAGLISRYGLLASLLMLACVAIANASEPERLWQQVYGQAGLDYVSQAMAPSKGGGVWIAGTAIDPKSTKGSFWLWQVAPNGERIREIELVPPGSARPTSVYANVRAIETVGSDAVLVIEFEPGRPVLITVDQKGDQKTIRDLSEGSEEIHVFGLTAESNEEVLVVGRRGREAYAAKVALNGELVWKQTYAPGSDGTSAIATGVQLLDDSLIMLIVAGTYGAFGTGPSSVLVAWVSPDTGEAEFGFKTEGITASLAISSGQPVVVLDADPTSTAQEFVLLSLNGTLHELRRKPVVSIRHGLEPLCLSSALGSDLLVAGSNEARLWMARISAGGDKRWVRWDEGIEALWTCDALEVASNSLYLLSSVIDAAQQGPMRRRVGVARFALRTN